MKKRPSRKELNRKIADLEQEVKQLRDECEYAKRVSEGTEKLFKMGTENPRTMALWLLCLDANCEFALYHNLSDELMNRVMMFCKEEK